METTFDELFENNQVMTEEILYLSITPVNQNGKKILQIRAQIHDKKRIDKILKQAFQDESIPAKIIIRDKIKAYARCVDLEFIDPKQIVLQ